MAIITIIGMMAGLFISRSVLSVSMIIFIINGIFDINIIKKIKAFLNNKIVIAFALIFLVPFISGLWSSNTPEWWTRTAVKLPFILLPVGFFALNKLPEKHFINLNRFFIALMLAGSVWSVIKYWQNTAFYHEQYLRAQVIPTPFDDNHIYFSFSVVVTILLLIKLFIADKTKTWRWVYGLTGAWFIVYLHILSAKTGLLCLYISLLMLGFYLLKKTKKKKLALITVLLVLCLPFVAYKISPTFKNRVGYVLYDYGNYSRGNFIEGLSDGNRYLSLKAGWDIFKIAPVSGIGFGDLWGKVDEWNRLHRPQIKDYERMLPSSEIFLYICGAGITGGILLLIAILIPLFYKPMQKDITWIGFHVIMIVFLLYEVTLEAQFGVFVYAFFCFWWQQSNPDKIISL
ncbi:MAG: hypothetical protein ACM3H8_03590 [Sphingobacteriales bacterium]